MRTATGYITVVQEQRFRLVTGDGQGLLLTLAHDAPVEISDLYHLHKANTQVIVEYTGEPNLTSGVAHTVQPSSATSRRLMA